MNRFVNNRRTLYLILGIVLVSVFTLTIAYASLSVALNIVGSAEVNAANWDIHLGNANVDSGSVSNTVPIITSPTTATFTASLVNPGDYYQFTIDVINDGTIDAMIDSVIKTPELTTDQAKYLNYIVEYQNGESINTKQLVSAGSFVRLKIKVEFRKDISVSDLPSSSITLNMSFKVKYIQSDGNVNVVPDNGVKNLSIVSGDLDTVGSEICIGAECFYVMSSTEDDVTMLAKYNLEVGYYLGHNDSAVLLPNPTGRQFGYTDETFNPYGETGITFFADTNYWGDTVNYPSYVYSSSSLLYEYNSDYKTYLESLGVDIIDVRLATSQEAIDLGCVYNEDEVDGDCYNAPDWINYGYTWTSDAYDSEEIFCFTSSYFGPIHYGDALETVGLRPVIEISKSEF